MMLRRKGYAMVEWGLILGIIIGILAISQPLLQNALEKKSLMTAHYILWTGFGDKADWEPGSDFDNTRSKSKSQELKSVSQFENHAGEMKSVMSGGLNFGVQDNVSTSVSTETTGEGLGKEFLDKVPLSYGKF